MPALEAGHLYAAAVLGQPLVYRGKTYSPDELDSLQIAISLATDEVQNKILRDEVLAEVREALHVPALVNDVVALQRAKGTHLFPGQIEALTMLFDQLTVDTAIESQTTHPQELFSSPGYRAKEAGVAILRLNYEFRNQPDQVDGLAVDIVTALQVHAPGAMAHLEQAVIKSGDFDSSDYYMPSMERGNNSLTRKVRLNTRVAGLLTSLAVVTAVFAELHFGFPGWVDHVNRTLLENHVLIKLKEVNLYAGSITAGSMLAEKISDFVTQLILEKKNLQNIVENPDFAGSENHFARALEPILSGDSCRAKYTKSP
jgi:hypothetical protein